MKKIFTLTFVILLLAMAGCSGSGGGSDENDDSNADVKASIFVIDGMDSEKTYSNLLSEDDSNTVARIDYLCSGLLQADGFNLSAGDCHSFGGTSSSEAWSGDATKTFEHLDDLSLDLTEKSQQAKQEGKKFILIAHSWGTQLATLGLSMSGVEPDLFITLSDPEGSTYVSSTSYTNEFYKIIPPLSVSGAQTLVWDLVRIYGVGAVSPINVKAKKWINYWDVGDMFSGPLKSIYPSNQIEDRTVIDLTTRTDETTREVHAITSLNESFWTVGNGVSQEVGNTFRNRVISDILQVN